MRLLSLFFAHAQSGSMIAALERLEFGDINNTKHVDAVRAYDPVVRVDALRPTLCCCTCVAART
jgi:hypothetical protein